MYFSTNTVCETPSIVDQERPARIRTTLPARPPAMRAKPMKRNNRARHTALESPKPSSPRTRSLSIKFTTSMPSREQIPGTQSTKPTCTGGGTSGSPIGECACAERTAASRNVQLASANYSVDAHTQATGMCARGRRFGRSRRRRWVRRGQSSECRGRC